MVACDPAFDEPSGRERVPGASVVGHVDDTQSGPGVRRGLVELRGQRLALEPGERLFARRDGRGGLITSGRVEVVAGADRGEPLLVGGRVGGSRSDSWQPATGTFTDCCLQAEAVVGPAADRPSSAPLRRMEFNGDLAITAFPQTGVRREPTVRWRSRDTRPEHRRAFESADGPE